MKHLLLMLILLSNLIKSHSQNWFQEKGYALTYTTNSIFSMQGAHTYENLGEMHSEYLILLPNGRFVFIGHHEVVLNFAVGYWQNIGDHKISVNSDESMSQEVIQNEDRWKSYGLKKSPYYLSLEDWTLSKKQHILTTTGFDGNVDSLIRVAESFIQSLDLSKCLVITDTLERYTPSGNVTGYYLRDYYYDAQGLPVKYATRGIKQSRTDDAYGIYFLPGNMGKVSYENKNEGATTTYFSGQKVVSTNKTESALNEYNNWKGERLAAEIRFEEDHSSSLRDCFGQRK